jgi:signal transduction histidine kinase
MEVSIEAGLPSALTDANRLHQVLGNLLLNAIRFTPDNGKITVSADKSRLEDGWIHVCVADSGIGIERDQLERIFDEFYEVAPSAHHHSGTIEFKSGGIGLGLSVVRGILEMQGGKIWAESARSEGGAGSSFHFLLPLAVPPAPPIL